jgi:hypothetical protein
MSETIIRNGRRYTFKIEHDDGMGEPWKEHDGHGVVSDWTRRDKAPGEVIIASDRGSHRFYDIAGTTRLARRDHWGLSDASKARLAARIGREPKRGDIVAEAVRLDCERMRGWCNDQWHWCGVIVTSPEGETRSLWGIESDGYEYHAEVAGELIDELESERADAMAADIAASRPDLSPEARP